MPRFFQIATTTTVSKAVRPVDNQSIGVAIKAAQDTGAKVRREDWVFPNWNPLEDYGDEQYKALT